MHYRNNELTLCFGMIVFSMSLITIDSVMAAEITNNVSSYNNAYNISSINSVTRGDNIVPFSTLSNLSSTSPNPIRASCFVYGYVSNDSPLGNLLIIKFRRDGSCNPTIELFTNLGTVIGIVPGGNNSEGLLGYDALVFIKYIEKPSQKKNAFVS
jgi:hypothetical protein